LLPGARNGVTIIGARATGRDAPMTEPGEAEVRVEPTIDDVDELVGPATPHFALQLRARVLDLVRDLPADHPVRHHAEEQAALLERLAFATSKAEEGPVEPSTRIGWEEIPSHATVDEARPPAEA
jgi:hypothetical protein